MSMCLYLKAGSEPELEKLARSGDALAGIPMSGFGGGGFTSAPIDDLAAAILTPQMEEIARLHGVEVEQLMTRATKHMQKKLAEMRAAMAYTSNGAAANDHASSEILDLHKSWHLLHYLFTGAVEEAPPPGGILMCGGREIGEDLGYGPPRLLDPAATKEFAAFLTTLTIEQLNERVDIKKMKKLELYSISNDADEVQEEIAEYFPKLKDYVEKTAERGEGILIWLM